MSQSSESSNPYVYSEVAPQAPAHRPEPADVIPTFPKVMLIITLVFCSLRLLSVPLAFVGYFALSNMDPPPPQLVTIPFEILTAASIAIFGLLAAGLLLARKPVGMTFVYLTVIATIGSWGVGIWQGFFAISQVEPGSPQYAAGLTGMFMMIGIRIAWLIAFLASIYVYKQWQDKQQSETAEV